MKKSVVLIPAYNASKSIKKVVNKINRKLIDEIIVVNDGSTDDTLQVLRKIENIKIITHPKNKGYGAATITLYKEALKGDFDYFITLHSDLAHDPKEINKMIKPLKKGIADIVLGDRIKGTYENATPFINSKILGAIFFGHMPAYKFIANIILTNFQKLCYGININSFHSGYRACNRCALEIVPFEKLTHWYQYDTEFLIEASEKKLRVTEVPVNSFYFEDAGSSVPVLQYGLRETLSAIYYWLNKKFIKTYDKQKVSHHKR